MSKKNYVHLQTYGCQAEGVVGKEWIRNLGLADANNYV